VLAAWDTDWDSGGLSTVGLPIQLLEQTRRAAEGFTSETHRVSVSHFRVDGLRVHFAVEVVASACTDEQSRIAYGPDVRVAAIDVLVDLDPADGWP
jgi:hypothetical protein